MRAIALVIALLVCSHVRATDPGSVYPRITRQQYLDFTKSIELDAEQRLIVEMLFNDYTRSMSDLMVRAESGADAAGQRRVDEALKGRRRMAPEELRAQRIAVLEVLREIWPEADMFREELLGTIVGILGEDQLASIEATLPALRRTGWLEAWRAAAAEREYAGEGVDLVLLAAAARDAELNGIDASELDAILAEYATSMDATLAEYGPAMRSATLERRLAQISRDDTRRRAAERSAIEAWQYFYTLNEQTAAVIGGLAESTLGTAAGTAWSKRVRAATFPWLLENTAPERRIEWIRDAGVNAATLEKAEMAYRAYETGHDRLANEAITLMLKGRVELGRILHPSIDPSSTTEPAEQAIYQELLKNSGARSHANRTAVEQLEAVLPAEQRVAMRRAVR